MNAAQSHFHPEVDSLGDWIRWASLQEAEVIEGLKSIDKTAPKALTDGTVRWEEDNALIYYKGRLYVPNDCQLHKDIVRSCHDALTGGHPGKNGTMKLVSCYYWWMCTAGFISAYIEGCDKCQCYRKDIHPKAQIQPQEIPEGPWQIVSVDLVGPLPLSKGKDMILNVVDHYRKKKTYSLSHLRYQLMESHPSTLSNSSHFMGSLKKSSVIGDPNSWQEACAHSISV